LLFSYDITSVQVKQHGLKLNVTHELLVYADNINMLGGSVHTVKKHTESLLVASKQVGLEVNDDKSKCMVMSRDQNAGRSHNIQTDSSSLELVEHFEHLGRTLTNQYSIQEELKRRLKSGNACYHSVHNFMSTSLLPEKFRDKSMPVVLYGCADLSLTLREKRWLRVFESRVQKRMFGA
jgi:hypothetical protein